MKRRSYRSHGVNQESASVSLGDSEEYGKDGMFGNSGKRHGQMAMIRSRAAGTWSRGTTMCRQIAS